MSWGRVLFVLALACLASPASSQLQLVVEWLVKDGASTAAALSMLQNSTLLQSALQKAAVDVFRSAGIVLPANQSLVVQVRNVTGEMRSPTPSPTPRVEQADGSPPLGLVVGLSVGGFVILVLMCWTWTLFRPGPWTRLSRSYAGAGWMPMRQRHAVPVIEERIL